MRNDFAVKCEQVKEGKTYLFVDTTKAVFRGMKWAQLGDFGKRKAENVLFLTRMDNGKKEQLNIKYV